jgi:hypothetical protein
MTYFTSLTENTATATVVIKRSNTQIGTKTFTISKQKTGATGLSGFAYRLQVSPNSWNTSVNANQTVTFTAHKIAPEGITALTLGTNTEANYYVRQRGQTSALGSSTTISNTTTFELVYKNGSNITVVDTETVSAFKNGDNGTGTKGDTVGIVTAYIRNNNQDFSSKPGTNSLGGDWSLQEMEPIESQKYVWSSTGNFTTSDSTTTYSNWTSPKLHAAWNDYNVNSKQYAEYLAATNFEYKNAIVYGNKGEI